MLSTGIPPCHFPARTTRCRAFTSCGRPLFSLSVRVMGQICAKRRREGCRAHCVPGCIFCRVVKESCNPGSRVVYEDELVLALPDIHPAAVEHLLVIPREHVPNTSSLTAADIQLVRHMRSVGQQLLLQRMTQKQQQPYPQQQQHLTFSQQQQQQQQLSVLKFGFHKPPFRSVDHLHLHCFILPHKLHRWMQYQSRINWITADQLIDELARKPSHP